MKNITKQQCEEFKKNPTANPLTGRKIQEGKITHTMLSKACSQFTVSPKKEITKKTVKSKRAYIPPLGPMMHWEYKITLDFETGLQLERKNATQFLRFIQDRYFALKNEKELSKSEFNDYVDMLAAIRSEIAWSKNTYDVIDTLHGYFMGLKKRVKLINDLPKYDIVYNVEISQSRASNRKTICEIYNTYAVLKLHIEDELKHKSNLAIQSPHRLFEYKKYLDHMIKLKLFTYDDIYKHTFENDKFPEEIAALYKKYEDKYYPNSPK